MQVCWPYSWHHKLINTIGIHFYLIHSESSSPSINHREINSFPQMFSMIFSSTHDKHFNCCKSSCLTELLPIISFKFLLSYIAKSTTFNFDHSLFQQHLIDCVISKIKFKCLTISQHFNVWSINLTKVFKPSIISRDVALIKTWIIIAWQVSVLAESVIILDQRVTMDTLKSSYPQERELLSDIMISLMYCNIGGEIRVTMTIQDEDKIILFALNDVEMLPLP